MRLNLLRNALANLAGGLVPALVTLLTLPFIVRSLGSDSYGVLVLITSIIGYFSVLDLNVTAGSVKFVAQHHATGDVRTRNQTVTCGLGMYVAIGLAGCLLILILYNYLILNIFYIPLHLQPMAADSLRLGAFAFLCGQVQVYLHSVPQAIRRYDWTAAVESAFGTLVPLATVAVLWLGYGLFEVVLVRTIASLINIVLLAMVIRRLLPNIAFEWPDKQVVVALARFSGFSYLSRLAAVAYAQGDKLIIGAMLTMTALAQYAVPFMLVNRLYALTYRLGAVLFPVASALNATDNARRLREVYLYGVRYTLFVNCAMAGIVASLAHEVLYYWMGPDIAQASTEILVILAIAGLLDSATNIPSLVNDGLGHPRVTGLFALVRAALGLALTFVLAATMGVIGAAYAQLITSAVVPMVFLWFIHGRTVPVAFSDWLRTAIVPLFPVAAIFAAFLLLRTQDRPLTLDMTLLTAVLALLVLAVYGLLAVFRRDDRAALIARVIHRHPAG